MLIRELASDDLGRVAEIHREELPDDFCSLLGKDFLAEVFYPELLKVSEVALGVAEEGEIVGFAFFTSDNSYLRHMALRRFFAITRYTLPNILKIGFLRYLFEVVILLFYKGDWMRGAELSYIAVSKAYQGKGLGGQLVEKGLASLRGKGIHHCWVKTLASAAGDIKFYKSVGFNLIKVHMGRAYMLVHLDTTLTEQKENHARAR